MTESEIPVSLRNISLDISKNGFNSSTMPNFIRTYCAGELMASLPPALTMRLFKSFYENRCKYLNVEFLDSSDNKMLITFDKNTDKKKSEVSYFRSPSSPGENTKVKPILTPFDNDFCNYDSTASINSVAPPTPRFKADSFSQARSTLETPSYEPVTKLPKLTDPTGFRSNLPEQDFSMRIENETEASNQNFGKECESYSLTVEHDNTQPMNSSKIYTLTCKLCSENHYSRKSNDRKKLMAAYRTHKYRHHSEKGRMFLEKLQSGNTNLSEIQLDPSFSSFLMGNGVDKENKFFKKSGK